jgi:cobalt-zinc-cadmium resistance protein CzcA
VAVGPQFSRGSASHNGQEAVSITIEKQYGSDTLTTTENIRAALDRIARGLPSGVSLNAFYDQSRIILRAIRHVEVSLVEGAVLIVAVMLLFMGSLRGSLIASLTIPFSVAIALVIMELLGVDLTVMSIGGLAIGIGKVANGSIIMVENIHRVLRERRGQASILELTAAAAHEVAGPLVSASIIILLVFVPLLTLGDIEGAMFRPTALAVGAALLGALVLNLTLQPVLAATFLGDRPLIARTLGLTERLAVHYRRLLEGAIRRRRLVLGVCLGAVLLGAVAFSRLGKEFVPVLDEGAILVSTVMLPETSLAESTAMGQRIEKILMAFPEVVSVTRTTGSAEGTEHVHPVNHSHYHVELRPREQRNRGFEEITWAMREQLDALPGVAYIFEQPIANRMAEMLTGTEGQLAIKVFGTDIQMLGQTVEEVRAVLAQVPGVADLQVEQTAGIPQLEIRLDRERLARFGVAVADVAELVETALNGLEATEVFEKDRVTTVLVRLSESYRRNEESIRRLLVDTPGGQRIPLAELASIERTEGPQTIFREGLMRRKILVCNVAGRDLGGFVAEAREAIGRRVSLPPGTHITFGGQYESQTRALRHLSISLGLVALVIFVVLLTSFGRVLEPLVILLCVPVTLVGGIVGLVLAGETLNVSSTIGLIALFGIGIQNDLILVAKIAEIRRAGEPTCAAVIEGSLVKFRAILITNLVMIVGVLPLALGVTTGAELHRPLAVVYIGGFLFAILLKMVAVPALYATLAREEVPSPAPAG